MFHPFVHNIGFIAALCLLQWLITKRFPGNLASRTWLQGILFGLVAMASMIVPVWTLEGIIFDGRSVVLSLSAFFWGPLAGLIAGAIAAAYRLWLGGGGAPVGVAVIASSVILGCIASRLVSRPGSARTLFLPLLALGLTVHILALAWFMLLPLDFVDVILGEVALPYVLIFTAATVALGLMLREFEKIGEVDLIIGESEDRFRRLFDSAAISLWDEDLTGVLRSFSELREAGVTDLRSHMREHPEFAAEVAGKIEVKRINPASLELFAAKSPRELKHNLQRTFTAESHETYVEELCALWEGKALFRSATVMQTLAGERIDAVISVPLPRTEVAARSVPVSIVNVTDIREAQAAAERDRQHLAEILWGTRAGTWVWNVQTGETVFNERWAEIIGYTLAELEPVSIATWQKFAHPEDLARSGVQLEQVFARERPYYDCEARMRHKDGSWVWVADRGQVVEWTEDGKPLRMSGTHTDITRRKAAELETERLAAIRATLLDGHGAILQAHDEPTLMQEICNVLVRQRGHALVWIGEPEEGGVRLVRPVAVAGAQAGYMEGLEIHWADDERGQGPAGAAIRSRLPQVMHTADPAQADRPWARRMTRHGLLSGVAVPVCLNEKALAVINVYSVFEDAFDEEEVTLLSEFADNLALALDNQRTNEELTRVSHALERSSLALIEAVAATLEQRDPYTAGHQQRVAFLSVEIARELGWGHNRMEGLRLGALIHDIGKIAVPAEILNRPGKLSDVEFAIIKTHPVVGGDILKHVTFPWPIREMVLQHHERIDGSGYPAGLKGDAIIEEAKVLCVADVVEAINSHRPYRASLGLDEGIAEIRRGRGTIYDAGIVDACIRVVEREGFHWPSIG